MGDFGQVMSSVEMAANCCKDDARGLRNVSGCLFTNSNLAAIHAGRVTIKQGDMQLVRKLHGETW